MTCHLKVKYLMIHSIQELFNLLVSPVDVKASCSRLKQQVLFEKQFTSLKYFDSLLVAKIALLLEESFFVLF